MNAKTKKKGLFKRISRFIKGIKWNYQTLTKGMPRIQVDLGRKDHLYVKKSYFLLP